MIERNSSRSPSGPASTPEPAEQNPETGGRRGDAEQSGGRDGVGTYLEDLAVAQREQRPRRPSNAHLDLPGRVATTGGCWRVLRFPEGNG